MTEINEIKPFKQIPSCDADTILSITGAELEALQVFNIFKPGIAALESIFTRNLNEGNITIKYMQEDGTEIPKEQAIKYLELAREFIKTKEDSESESN